MTQHSLNIDKLIEFVRNGGKAKTGIDVYNKKGLLLLEKDVLVDNPLTLERLKALGIIEIPINPNKEGGLWNRQGKPILAKTALPKKKPIGQITVTASAPANIVETVQKVNKLKIEAFDKYKKAKQEIKNTLDRIKTTAGDLDLRPVSVIVNEIFEFITKDENAFYYLTREIFAYDEYLYNHSINVCTIGTAILRVFNELEGQPFELYTNKELHDISIGYFLHDIGKVLIPEEILNKEGALTEEEFQIVKTHSFEKGIAILNQNKLNNSYILNNIKYHHAALHESEPRCYPDDLIFAKVPPYVKIGKIADIYDAMTSRRCYKPAVNPVAVVTDIVRKYAEKDQTLQYILQAFVKSIGIYPAGSILYLSNGQMAFILHTDGPLVLPFTDEKGNVLHRQEDPFSLSDPVVREKLQIDLERPLLSPTEFHGLLPDYLQDALLPSKDHPA